jgi:nucleotide-binding universal stress UspA family protein
MAFLARSFSPRISALDVDRALDRAATLVHRWNARLVVVHALENASDDDVAQNVRNLPSWRRPEDRADAVAQELRADILEEGVTASVLIEAGEPGEVVLRAAHSVKADLIATGMARNEFLGRLLLGSTVDTLVRQAASPVLVVKKRVRRFYANVLIATDFSEASREALHAAVNLFGDCKLALLHAYRTHYGSFSDSDRSRKGWANIARDECNAFLAAAGLPDDVRRRLTILIEYGHPAPLLHDYVGIANTDLVFIGAPARGAILRALVGSRAEDILRSVPCDVMVVPARH